jgi:uncharacterized protein (DUF58 family)
MADVLPTQRDELQKYLDPRVLSQIHRLDLRTRLVVEGFMVGRHRSPFNGLSVEFHQHREYVPGDDLQHLDWKVFSRTDRFFIKQYEEETNLRCTFLMDVSESMKYAGAARSGAGLTKFHYGSCIAASLALLLLRQQDAAGLVTFDRDIVNVLPPSANPNAIKNIVHQLDRASNALQAKTAIEGVCAKVAEKLGRRGMVCLISDLLVDEDELLRGLSRLAHHGHDVIVLHVMDDEELTFPFEGNVRFVGLEQLGEMIVQPRSLRSGYMASLEKFLAGVKSRCASQHVSYRLVNTADNLGSVLGAFLNYRTEFNKRAASKRR